MHRGQESPLKMDTVARLVQSPVLLVAHKLNS
jgi:hypothetical protein